MLCEFLLPFAHPLGRAVRKMFWTKGELGDVTVRAHQPGEELYQRGEHLHLRVSVDNDNVDYKVHLEAFERPHIFLEWEGVKEEEEEEEEATKGSDAELSIPLDADSRCWPN